jgi:tetratricopeptide (TPR) repeat protein
MEIQKRGGKMNDEPVIFEINVNEFDFEILPLKIDIDLLRKDQKLREKAVSLFYEDHLADAGGEIKTEIDGDFIKVYWWPKSSKDVDQAIGLAIELLTKGAYRHAEPLLDTLNSIYPDRQDILFNYGMMLSDQGKLEKALKLLSRLTTLDEGNANAWNALGIAYLRNRQPDDAKKALQRSYELDPENGYTLRNFGGLLANENPSEALPLLEKAAKILPDDQQAQYGYALCLLENDEPQKADAVFIKAIEIAPYSELSEVCRTQRTEIAQKTMRDEAPDGLRMDTVMYCLSALKKFEQLGPEKAIAITTEIALLGRSGLDINDPEKKYTLKSLDGEFTGLQLVSYMYAGLKRIDPNQDAGIDLAKEYSMALKLFDSGSIK